MDERVPDVMKTKNLQFLAAVVIGNVFASLVVKAEEVQRIELDLGWNLISFQVLPDNPTPERVLSGLSIDPALGVESMWGYEVATDTWKVWRPGQGGVEAIDLQMVRHFQGYWLNLLLPGMSLDVWGNQPSDGRIAFGSGWNLLGFPAGDATGAGLAQIDAIFREHVQGPDPDVQLIYAIQSDGSALRWDFTIDRREGDFNADGVVNSVDQQFKFDFGLPDDDPATTEESPTADDFGALASGTGYWVYARRAFHLAPLLKTFVREDQDNEPAGNFPGPEDLDLDGDRLMDLGVWVSPEAETEAVQSILVFESGQETTQVVLNNAGAGILKWSVEFFPDAALAALSDNAIQLSMGMGETLTDTDSITLSADRTGLPPGTYGGQLVIGSNGGSRIFELALEVPEIVGDFVGVATIETVNGKAIGLPAIDLFVTFFRSPNGELRGQIRSDESSHFPVPVSLQGGRLGATSTEFISVGSYQLPSNAVLIRTPGTMEFTLEEGSSDDTLFNVDTVNPFPRPVFRELVFVGDRTRTDVALGGTFYDTLIGVTAEPIVVEGRFELTRESLEPSFQPSTGGSSPCTILFGSDQQIPDDSGEEKLYALNGTLGCPAVTDPVLIEQVRVYVHLEHANIPQLRLRLLSPTEDASDPDAGVLLYDGMRGDAPEILSSDLSWPALFSDATQGLYPQAGPTSLGDAYRGQRADQGNGEWRLGITDRVADSSGGRLTRWLVSFTGPQAFSLAGRVVDEGDNPLAGVLVSLTGAEVIRSALTDAQGGYSIENLPPHRYRISAQKTGYTGLSGGTGPIDLTADRQLEDIRLTLRSLTGSDLLITPAFGRVAAVGGGIGPFAGTLRYVAESLEPGDTYRYILQRYSRDSAEPNPGEPGFGTNVRAAVPVGSPILIPASPVEDPLVSFELEIAGVYSVTAVVFREGNEVDRVGESDPKQLEHYVLQIEDQLPTGASDGNLVMLAGGLFAGGGVVPFDFYPPTTPPGNNLDESPAAYVPVGDGNPASTVFTYRLAPAASPQLQIRLGEDMVRSVSVDLNRPSIRPDFAGGSWDPFIDPWEANNPAPQGMDLNVAGPLISSLRQDYGRGPIQGVGWIAYDLLPGDGAPRPLPAPAPSPDAPARSYVITSALGATISGHSQGGGYSLSGGARFEPLNDNRP